MDAQLDREHAWQADIAVLAALTIHIALPLRFIPGSRWLMPALELVLLAVVYVQTRGWRVAGEGWVRALRVALIGIIALANFASLGLLLSTLITGHPTMTGKELILSALGIWAINVIVFALCYWEFDSGGPGNRSDRTSAIRFRFPQTGDDANWTPAFFDHFYVSITNAAAFSPTDAMPYTPLTKGLMMVQALASLVTIALVAAHAVNILA